MGYVTCKIHTTVISHTWNLVLNSAVTWGGGAHVVSKSRHLGRER